jgi:uncharacterized protein
MAKFKDLSSFERPLEEGYRLLPFRFSRLTDDDYVLTNSVGEYHILDRASLQSFARHQLISRSPIYEDLKGKHFLIDADSSVALDLLALKTRTKVRPLAEFTSLHMFVVTLRCEHSCPYCQVSRQNDGNLAFDMPRDVADRAIDYVFKSPAKALKIEFQGGEPLLNFPLIRHIVERANQVNQLHRRDLQFVIATNLALITDDILEYCRSRKILLSTSMDGPKDLHNKNRPRPGGNSYEKAVEGIEKARAALGIDGVGALMTTTEASLTRVRDIIDEYIERGFSDIFLRPISPYGFAIKTKWHASYDTEAWLKFYFEGLDYILSINRAGHKFVESYAATILSKMLTPFQPGYVDLMSPAGIGIAAVVYNYDGDVYASDEARMLAEMGDKKFRLGHVLNDSYEDIFQADALLDPLEQSFSGSAPMCIDCAFEPYCGADPVYHYATQHDYVGHKPTSSFCQRNMAIFRHLIGLMQDEETKELLLGWVK